MARSATSDLAVFLAAASFIRCSSSALAFFSSSVPPWLKAAIFFPSRIERKLASLAPISPRAILSFSSAFNRSDVLESTLDALNTPLDSIAAASGADRKNFCAAGSLNVPVTKFNMPLRSSGVSTSDVCSSSACSSCSLAAAPSSPPASILACNFAV